MIGSFVASGLSFAKIWKSRHEIDKILDDTRERRQSEDKEVRKEANWEAVKKITPIVAFPAAGIIGSVAMGVSAHSMANAEIANACATIDSMGRVLASESYANRPVGEGPNSIEAENEERIREAERRGIPFDKYFLRATGEVFCLPRSWRLTGIDDVNDMIEDAINSYGHINLGTIRHMIKDDCSSIGVDDILCWEYRSYHDVIPHLTVTLPEETHGDGELMWEIRVEGNMCVDYDTAAWA